jgi:predicted ATPase
MTEPERTRYTEICLPSDEPFSSYSFDTSENANVISSLSLVNIFIGTNNSGKSRLLRSIFSLKDDDFLYNPNNYSAKEYFDLIESLNKEVTSAIGDFEAFIEKITKNYFDDILIDKHTFFSIKNIKYDLIKQKLNDLKDCKTKQGTISYGINNVNELTRISQKYTPQFEALAIDSYLGQEKRYYLPILRGMRPLDENDQHINLYKDRTLKDYFQAPNPPLPNKEKMIIFTGLELYQTLKEKLLGEPEDRELVKKFENFLSEKFFNSKSVTLIPKEKGDDPRVVNIKIGNEQQFPIYQLGDGLQNLIICTFNIFTEKDRCLFFIEEPDMLMHPSLQRSFLEILSNFDQHQYFITSHSNHFLDMTLDFANISVFHFSKIEDENKIEAEKPSFKVEVASAQDRRILMNLGVQNSSVFLSNATIWVEGITDRLYLRAYMKKYIQELEDNDPEKAVFNKFREDYHYSFVEYQGSNLTHWSFDPDDEDIKKIKSSYVCANSFLIADGDVATKGDRVEIYKEMLGDDKFFPLDVKEIENLIPLEVLKKLVEANFKKYGGDINLIKYEDYAEQGIKVGLGEYLEKFLLSKPSKPPKKSKKSQSNMEKSENEFNELIVVYKADSGTIKSKINFCEKAIKVMEDPNFSWKLTDKLEELCKAIFEHIKSQNITK